MVSVVTFLCCFLVASGATATATYQGSTSASEPEGGPVRSAEPSRAAALTALAAIARRHPQSVQRLLAAFTAAAAAATTSADRDDGGGGGGGGDGGAANNDVLLNSRILRWEVPPEADDWTTGETSDSSDEAAEQVDPDPDPDLDSEPDTFLSPGRTTKRALSVLSRWTPFTSLGNGGRRASRFAGRARPGSAPRDFISAETRGDFGDRPLGQPMRWGRR